jgi:uncharacterized iron-regulated membrane protein
MTGLELKGGRSALDQLTRSMNAEVMAPQMQMTRASAPVTQLQTARQAAPVTSAQISRPAMQDAVQQTAFVQQPALPFVMPSTAPARTIPEPLTSGSQVTADLPQQYAPPPPADVATGSKKGWIAAGVLSLAALAGGGFYLYVRSQKKGSPPRRKRR